MALRWPIAAVVLVVAGLSEPASGQPGNAPSPGGQRPDRVAAAVAEASRTAQVAERPAALVFSNRAVVVLRATVLSRPPETRAAAAADLLKRLASENPGGRVVTRPFDTNAVEIGIDAQPVIFIFSADVDPLAGEELTAKATDAAARLQVAFDEAIELHSPGRLARAAAIGVAATVLYLAAVWFVAWVDRRIAARISSSAERRLAHVPGATELVRASDTQVFVHRLFTILTFVVGAILTYAWAAIVLRRFPYTRPWGESLRSTLFSMVATAGRLFVDALPNMFTVLVIVLVTRGLLRLARIVFAAVETGRIVVPGVHPDTAVPTRRIVAAMLWLCALIVSYPYLPGSQSDVFKGVSVFVGLVVSLGSTGLMNQAMSGLMVTYARAIRCGDFVKIGDIEGTVTSVGTLATKVRTPRNEEVTIPNAIVVSHATTNYTRNDAQGVYSWTAVTIGYDTPWRQVQALLLRAAERTPGVKTDPKPVVLQTALHDWYVEYRLFVALDHPHLRFFTLNVLHANIQDAFNEFGVQIMSPRYVGDPKEAKIVPPSLWYPAPAAPAQDLSSHAEAASLGREHAGGR